jgi:hypothetical protein
MWKETVRISHNRDISFVHGFMARRRKEKRARKRCLELAPESKEKSSGVLPRELGIDHHTRALRVMTHES